LAGYRRGKSSRKAISPNLIGGVAVACLVIGSGFVVYNNIIAASVYPTLGARYDEPVVRRPATVAARGATQAVSEAFAALPGEAAPVAKTTTATTNKTITVASSAGFEDRFAAAAPQGVASNAAAAAVSDPPKLAEAAKPKEAASTQLALNVPKPSPRPAEAKTTDTRTSDTRTTDTRISDTKTADIKTADAKTADVRTADARTADTKASSPGSFKDMAQRAKAAVMSIASGERQSITEKLWGNQPASSHGSLLAFASADADITGSIGRARNPALGGQAPYERDTAVYDISAHMVYLPDGSKLEAHSGLGSKLDDPRSAPIRMHGVTPPHIYELKPREALFHGVPALRLNPIGGEEAIYGRSGLLAHTYMLGPNGDSNGCVSFRDYNAFLNAYRNQGIKKLAVVARVE
jgi:hypothetical protein